MDLKRGAIVLTALSGDFGKPRPALVIQSNWAMELPSITLLPITSTLQAAPHCAFLFPQDLATGS